MHKAGDLPAQPGLLEGFLQLVVQFVFLQQAHRDLAGDAGFGMDQRGRLGRPVLFLLVVLGRSRQSLPDPIHVGVFEGAGNQEPDGDRGEPDDEEDGDKTHRLDLRHFVE